jgi:hypothetical protein
MAVSRKGSDEHCGVKYPRLSRAAITRIIAESATALARIKAHGK